MTELILMLIEPFILLFNAGGFVLQLVAFALFVLWLLILLQLFTAPLASPSLLLSAPIKKLTPWPLRQINRYQRSHHQQNLNRLLPLISGLIALAPLLGLLGTVTGMIQLFEQLQLSGNLNPSLLGDGIAKATLPTLAGLITGLSGVIGRKFIINKNRHKMMKIPLVGAA